MTMQLEGIGTVARRLCIPVSTMYELRRRGEFSPPDVVIGRSVRWLSTTVDAFIESNKRKTAAGM